jgi:hypothetical protein
MYVSGPMVVEPLWFWWRRSVVRLVRVIHMAASSCKVDDAVGAYQMTCNIVSCVQQCCYEL